jgi:hypothetical protein
LFDPVEEPLDPVAARTPFRGRHSEPATDSSKRIDSRPRLSDARVTIQQEEDIMAALEKGITPDGEG